MRLQPRVAPTCWTPRRQPRRRRARVLLFRGAVDYLLDIHSSLSPAPGWIGCPLTRHPLRFDVGIPEHIVTSGPANGRDLDY